MAKWDQIKNCCFLTGTDPTFDIPVFRHYNFKEDVNWINFPYTNIIYIDQSKEKEIIAINHSYSVEYSPPENGFVELLKKIDKPTKDKISYLLVFYLRAFQYLEYETWFGYTKGNSDILNKATEDTYGKIVFYHQAANIFSLLTGVIEKEGYEWAKKMGSNRKEAQVQAEKVQVTENETLNDLWSSYTILGKLFVAPQKSTNLLYNFINN